MASGLTMAVAIASPAHEQEALAGKGMLVKNEKKGRQKGGDRKNMLFALLRYQNDGPFARLELLGQHAHTSASPSLSLSVGSPRPDSVSPHITQM